MLLAVSLNHLNDPENAKGKAHVKYFLTEFITKYIEIIHFQLHMIKHSIWTLKIRQFR